MDKELHQHSLKDCYVTFVALAAIQACNQLTRLLKSWPTEPTQAVLDDAAKMGFHSAMQIMYPGLTRHPFEQSPLQDISRALKFHYKSEDEQRKRFSNPMRTYLRESSEVPKEIAAGFRDRDTGEESGCSDIFEQVKTSQGKKT